MTNLILELLDAARHVVVALFFCACASQKPRIDLDLRGATMHDAFRAVALAARVNIDVDPDVEGSVTIVVRAQPWDQVLARIVREHGLHVRQVGGIYYVSTTARERAAFTGARVTLAFDETPIREAMLQFERVAKQRVVVDDGIEMRVTMRVRDVPWDLALEHLTRKEGLRVVRAGDGLRIVRR